MNICVKKVTLLWVEFSLTRIINFFKSGKSDTQSKNPVPTAEKYYVLGNISQIKVR